MKLGPLTIRLNENGETRIAAKSSSNLPDYWQESTRTTTNLAKWRTMYEQGGLYAEAVDLHWLYALTGYTLVGKNETQVQQVQDYFDRVQITNALREMIIDAKVFGDGFSELLMGQGSMATTPVGLKAIPGDSMWIDKDNYGELLGYEQKFSADATGTPIDTDVVVHLQLDHMAGGTYGQSVMRRAYDEIMADTTTREGTKAGIERHGFPKWKVLVDPDGKKTLTDTEKTAIENTFKDIDADNEFVLFGPIDIQTIDAGGAAQVKEYNDVMVSRVCAAMGVPEELLGLRQGSTDATAVSRIDAFYKKIETYQRIIETCVNRQIIDKLLGVGGAVRIVFDDVSPKDEKAVAEVISTLTGATPLDPWAVISPQWAQQRLDIDPAQHEKEVGEDDDA